MQICGLKHRATSELNPTRSMILRTRLAGDPLPLEGEVR